MSIQSIYTAKDLIASNARKVMIAGGVALASAVSASAVTLTQLLTNLTEIATSLTTMATSIMALFMEPPLVVFVGLAIFVAIVGIVRRLMGGGRK